MATWPSNDSPLTTAFLCLDLCPHPPQPTPEFQETTPLGLLWLIQVIPSKLLPSLQVKNFLSELRSSNPRFSTPESGQGGTDMDGFRRTTGNQHSRNDVMVSELLNKLNLEGSPSSVPEKYPSLTKRSRAQEEQVLQARTARTSSDSVAQPPQTPETSTFRNQMPSPTSTGTPSPGPQGNQVRHWQD